MRDLALLASRVRKKGRGIIHKKNLLHFFHMHTKCIHFLNHLKVKGLYTFLGNIHIQQVSPLELV